MKQISIKLSDYNCDTSMFAAFRKKARLAGWSGVEMNELVFECEKNGYEDTLSKHVKKKKQEKKNKNIASEEYM